MPTPVRQRAFTLIELLVVIGIIGLLMGLLVPTITTTLRSMRVKKTQFIVRDLEMGLQAFKHDFGDFPPSNLDAVYPRTGAAKLVYYMRGPGGSGWGTTGGGRMPFGQSGSAPKRAYGPYYQADDQMMQFMKVGAEYHPVAFLDGFEPAGPILYFKPTVDRNGIISYNKNDNDRGGSDPEAKSNFASDVFFRDCVVSGTVTEGSTTKTLYHREDFMLISAGDDGRFGAVGVEQDDDLFPAERDAPAGKNERFKEVIYDDITNWNQ